MEQTEVMQIKEWLHRNIFIYVMKKDDLKQSFKHFLYKYLLKSDTCQLESAQEKKNLHALKISTTTAATITTVLVW